VERAKQNKLEIIVRATGEAQAATQFNQQLKNDPAGNYLQLKRIETSKDIAKIIANSPNKVFLSADNLMFSILGTPMEKK